MGINLIDIALIMKDNSKNAFACHHCKSLFYGPGSIISMKGNVSVHISEPVIF